jgi:transcriptional regulator with XRE-family HTH domain
MNSEALKNLIEQKGLKLKFLAQQLGIRYETLYFKLKGEKEFSQSEIKKLCKLLDIPNREIFNFF